MILDACPACRRPYDVTHLEPRTELRCQCQHVFAIRHRARHVDVRWCRRCGGVLGSQEHACSYCGAGVEEAEHESRLCPSCLARSSSEARHCAGCGSSLVPQALEPLAASLRCPRCRGGLRLRDLGSLRAVECRDCQGLWLAAEDFLTLARIALRRTVLEAETILAGGDAPSRPLGANEPPGRAYLACLRCGELMLRRQLCAEGHPLRLVVDVCARHGLWLDRDELELALRLQEAAGGRELVGARLFRGARSAPAQATGPEAASSAKPSEPSGSPLVRAFEFIARRLGGAL